MKNLEKVINFNSRNKFPDISKWNSEENAEILVFANGKHEEKYSLWVNIISDIPSAYNFNASRKNSIGFLVKCDPLIDTLLDELDILGSESSYQLLGFDGRLYYGSSSLTWAQNDQEMFDWVCLPIRSSCIVNDIEVTEGNFLRICMDDNIKMHNSIPSTILFLRTLSKKQIINSVSIFAQDLTLITHQAKLLLPVVLDEILTFYFVFVLLNLQVSFHLLTIPDIDNLDNLRKHLGKSLGDASFSDKLWKLAQGHFGFLIPPATLYLNNRNGLNLLDSHVSAKDFFCKLCESYQLLIDPDFPFALQPVPELQAIGNKESLGIYTNESHWSTNDLQKTFPVIVVVAHMPGNYSFASFKNGQRMILLGSSKFFNHAPNNESNVEFRTTGFQIINDRDYFPFMQLTIDYSDQYFSESLQPITFQYNDNSAIKASEMYVYSSFLFVMYRFEETRQKLNYFSSLDEVNIEDLESFKFDPLAFYNSLKKL